MTTPAELAAFDADIRRAELRRLDMVASLEWQDSGYAQKWQFISHLLRISPHTAKKLCAHADLIAPSVAVSGQPIEPKLPLAREAMAEAAITDDHVARIAKIVPQVPLSLRDQVEADLVAEARRFTPTELTRIGQVLLDAIDPDGPEPADKAVPVSDNEADFRDHDDGSISGQVRFGPETAAQLRPLLSSLAKPHGRDDRRTVFQRNGDALDEIIRTAANTGQLPIQGGEKPHLAVTVSLDTLQTGIGTATLDDGHTIPADTARRIACDAKIIPIVLGGNSQPLDIGEAKRTANRTLTRALAIRDKGCAFPSCPRTPRQSQAHHVVHWANGGPTLIDNLVLLCHQHHKLIHDTDWTVHIRHGQPVFTPPHFLRRPA